MIEAASTIALIVLLVFMVLFLHVLLSPADVNINDKFSNHAHFLPTNVENIPEIPNRNLRIFFVFCFENQVLAFLCRKVAEVGAFFSGGLSYLKILIKLVDL